LGAIFAVENSAQYQAMTEYDINAQGTRGIMRAIAAVALVRRCGLTQLQAAATLGLQSGAAVSYLVRMAKERAKSDRQIRKRIENIASA
jgi:hypothetical protein